MDWFLYDNGLRHERVKNDELTNYSTERTFSTIAASSSYLGMIFSNLS